MLNLLLQLPQPPKILIRTLLKKRIRLTLPYLLKLFLSNLIIPHNFQIINNLLNRLIYLKHIISHWNILYFFIQSHFFNFIHSINGVLFDFLDLVDIVVEFGIHPS